MSDTFENMIQAGEAFKKALGISDNEIDELLRKEKLGSSECEWNIIRNICQEVVKRKGLTQEQIKKINEKILNEVRGDNNK